MTEGTRLEDLALNFSALLVYLQASDQPKAAEDREIVASLASKVKTAVTACGRNPMAVIEFDLTSENGRQEAALFARMSEAISVSFEETACKMRILDKQTSFSLN